MRLTLWEIVFAYYIFPHLFVFAAPFYLVKVGGQKGAAQQSLSEMDSSRLQRLGEILRPLLFPTVFGLGGWAKFCPPSAVGRVHFCLAEAGSKKLFTKFVSKAHKLV